MSAIEVGELIDIDDDDKRGSDSGWVIFWVKITRISVCHIISLSFSEGSLGSLFFFEVILLSDFAHALFYFSTK